LEQRYPDLRSRQEDWGWFIWFRDDAVRLAVDIHCDQPTVGAFRIRLTSPAKKLIGSEMIDTTELDRLRDVVTSSIAAWAGPVRIECAED
jgi:hypothetical protein